MQTLNRIAHGLAEFLVGTRYSLTMFAAIAAVLVFVYCKGRHDEAHSRDAHQEALIAACQEDNRILQHRFDMLAGESDWLTLVSAEAKYQEGSQ
jgi:hypothetical protein